jgi:hypothetical protein
VPASSPLSPLPASTARATVRSVSTASAAAAAAAACASPGAWKRKRSQLSVAEPTAKQGDPAGDEEDAPPAKEARF